MAEIELSVLFRHYLKRKISDELTSGCEVKAWVCECNSKVVKVDWRFFPADARIKQNRLYPKIHD